MNLLLEIVIQQGLLLDLFGVIGIGLVAFGAVRLSQHFGSTGATLMTWGAIALLVGRIGMLFFTQVVTPFNQADFDPTLLAICKNLPLSLLTLGLGAIVWGFWGHEKQVAVVTTD